MKLNLGSPDRVIRIVFAIVVALLYALGEISGTAALVLGLLAVVFFATAVVGFCPLYAALKLSTKKAALK